MKNYLKGIMFLALFILLIIILNVYGVSEIILGALIGLVSIITIVGLIANKSKSQGIKLADNIHFSFCGPQDVLVKFHGKKLNIYLERSAIKNEKIIRIENPSKETKYYLPPNDKEQILSEDLKVIVNFLSDYYKKMGMKSNFLK